VRRIGLSIAAVLSALALATAVQAGPARAQPLRTGISGINEEALLAFQRVRDAGASYVRIAFEWSEIAPGAKPDNWQPDDPGDTHYDWRRVDEGVQHAVMAGLTPVAMIEEVPRWAERCHASTGGNCNPDPDALAAFATAAARRYSGNFGGLPRVAYWQGLNEPNLSIYFNPQFEGDRAVSAELYRALANRFYDAIKGVDPAATVILAGLGPIAVRGYTIGPMRFTRELLCMRGKERFRPAKGDCGGGVRFDIFDIHPYTTGGPTHTGGANDVELGDLAKLRSLLDAADRAGRTAGRFERTPLWVGEFSWDTNPPDPGGLPMEIETRWLAEALYGAWGAGVETFFWFSLRDRMSQPSLPFSQTLQSGLYFRGATLEQDQPKPIFFAFRFPFVAYPRQGGLFFWGRTPTSERGTVVIQVLEHGRWRRAAVARAGGAGIFRGLSPRRYGRNLRGAARAVFRGETSLPFGMRPVRDFAHPPFG
jgi:hypothetical protein